MARFLAVDYGRVRIGLALSDPTGMLASDLAVLRRVSDSAAVDAIADLVRTHAVDEVVVGLPLHMNGTVGERAEQCRAFAELIRVCTSKPVAMYDERLTTVAAERMLIAADMRRAKRKQVVDAVAATILLQSYLDFRNRNRLQQ